MDASTHLYELWSACCFIVIASATDIPKSWLYCGIKVHVIIIIIGLHQSADMWPVGTDIAWSVCLLDTTVCAVLKWLDHSRCCFWCGLWLGSWNWNPPGEWAVLEGFSRPFVKYRKYLASAKVIAKWQQRCGLLLPVLQQLVIFTAILS